MDETKKEVYQLTVIKKEPNPKYIEEMTEFESRNKYRNGYDMYDKNLLPPEKVTTNVLMVELTPEQYKKVKAEVLAVFE